jgi:hypothetical protein
MPFTGQTRPVHAAICPISSHLKCGVENSAGNTFISGAAVRWGLCITGHTRTRMQEAMWLNGCPESRKSLSLNAAPLGAALAYAACAAISRSER